MLEIIGSKHVLFVFLGKSDDLWAAGSNQFEGEKFFNIGISNIYPSYLWW